MISRRTAIARIAGGVVGTVAAGGLRWPGLSDEDLRRLLDAASHPALSAGRRVAAVGVAARGTPYRPHTLDAYLEAGGSPDHEPLTVSLSEFDCVTFVEACLTIGEMARDGVDPEWEAFERGVERIRYRHGRRFGYTSRLHYFSEWITDNVQRGRLEDIGRELGGVADTRPLRFMTANRDLYPALRYDGVYRAIQMQERALDRSTRWYVPTSRIPEVEGRLRTGDVVAFATSIEGLDVTHASFAYRTSDGVLRVLHAPLSGGVVEITSSTLHGYVRGLRRGTGILVARPVDRA